jgi:hypothetical protein
MPPSKNTASIIFINFRKTADKAQSTFAGVVLPLKKYKKILKETK